MGATLDIYIDTSSGQLIDGGSVIGGSLPTLTRNDSYTMRLRLLEKNSNGSYDDIDSTSASLKAGIGSIEEPPSSGSFKLSINGITSTAIPYNATAVCIYNAVSDNVSSVSLYGAESFGSYLLTATQPNTAMSFGSDTFTLFPASAVLISTRRNPSADVQAQQVIKLARNPIVYADTFTSTPTAGEIALTKIQDGGTGVNETYALTVGPLVRGGLFSLSFGSNSTTGIAPFTSAVSVQTAISQGISSITSNISVQEDGKQGYIIQFTGRLAQTNVTTNLLLDASGVNFIPLKQTTLTINTAEVEDAFADSGEATITPTIEIELTQSGSPKTVYQGPITIRKDLITSGSSVPGNQAEYYTKSETDALFVEDLATNVDASSRLLVASDTLLSFDYGNRQFYSNNGNLALDYTNGLDLYSSKIGFFGTSPVTQPNQSNVITALRGCGLLSSGPSVSTFGVFPLSSKTLTTTLSINFGTISNNSTNSVTFLMIGASVNDIVLLGIPSSVCQGLSFLGHVNQSSVVEVDAINATSSNITQSQQTFRVTVIGY